MLPADKEFRVVSNLVVNCRVVRNGGRDAVGKEAHARKGSLPGSCQRILHLKLVRQAVSSAWHPLPRPVVVNSNDPCGTQPPVSEAVADEPASAAACRTEQSPNEDRRDGLWIWTRTGVCAEIVAGGVVEQPVHVAAGIAVIIGGARHIPAIPLRAHRRRATGFHRSIGDDEGVVTSSPAPSTVEARASDRCSSQQQHQQCSTASDHLAVSCS